MEVLATEKIAMQYRQNGWTVSQAEAAGDISGDRAGTTVRHSAEDPSPRGTAPLEVWGANAVRKRLNVQGQTAQGQPTPMRGRRLTNRMRT